MYESSETLERWKNLLAARLRDCRGRRRNLELCIESFAYYLHVKGYFGGPADVGRSIIDAPNEARIASSFLRDVPCGCSDEL